MIAVAGTPQPKTQPQGTQDAAHTPPRIDEHDADYRRLHARAVRRLTASLRELVSELRTLPEPEHAQAQSRFIARHTALLRAAYAAGHAEGAKDYYGQVSKTPATWARDVEPSARKLAAHLGFYAPSVAKMAHEAQMAWRASVAQQRAASTLSEPSRGMVLGFTQASFDPALHPHGYHGHWEVTTGGVHESKGGGGRRTSANKGKSEGARGGGAKGSKSEEETSGKRGGGAKAEAMHQEAVAKRSGAKAAKPKGEGEPRAKSGNAERESTDVHGQRMPFSHAQFEEALKSGTRFGEHNAMETSRATIHGKDYLIKSSKQMEGSRYSEEMQQRNEAATVAGMKALGMEDLAAHEAYHVVGEDGRHYSVQSIEKGSADHFGQEGVKALAGSIETHDLERLMLGEYVLGMGDRHLGNLLVQEHRDGPNTIKSIDHGFSFKQSKGLLDQSATQDLWRANKDMASLGKGTPKLSRQTLRDVVSHQADVMRTIGHFGLSKAEVKGVQARFGVLEKLAGGGLLHKNGPVEFSAFRKAAGTDEWNYE